MRKEVLSSFNRHMNETSGAMDEIEGRERKCLSYLLLSEKCILSVRVVVLLLSFKTFSFQVIVGNQIQMA